MFIMGQALFRVLYPSFIHSVLTTGLRGTYYLSSWFYKFRGWVSFPRSHNLYMAKPQFEPRHSGSRSELESNFWNSLCTFQSYHIFMRKIRQRAPGSGHSLFHYRSNASSPRIIVILGSTFFYLSNDLWSQFKHTRSIVLVTRTGIEEWCGLSRLTLRER